MARFYWPLTPEEDREVRQEVARRLLEYHKDYWDVRDKEWPVLERQSGREELAFYRSTDIAWWEQLASVYPDEAADRMRRWAALSKRYGAPQMVVQQ